MIHFDKPPSGTEQDTTDERLDRVLRYLTENAQLMNMLQEELEQSIQGIHTTLGGLSQSLETDSGTALSRANRAIEADAVMESAITQNAQAITAKVSRGDVRNAFAGESSSVTITSGSIAFDTGTLIINAGNLSLDASGNATFAGTITGGGISAGNVTVTGAFRVQDGGADKGYIGCGTGTSGGGVSTRGVQMQDATGAGLVIVTDAGARMTYLDGYAGADAYVAQSGGGGLFQVDLWDRSTDPPTRAAYMSMDAERLRLSNALRVDGSVYLANSAPVYGLKADGTASRWLIGINGSDVVGVGNAASGLNLHENGTVGVDNPAAWRRAIGCTLTVDTGGGIVRVWDDSGANIGYIPYTAY